MGSDGESCAHGTGQGWSWCHFGTAWAAAPRLGGPGVTSTMLVMGTAASQAGLGAGSPGPSPVRAREGLCLAQRCPSPNSRGARVPLRVPAGGEQRVPYVLPQGPWKKPGPRRSQPHPGHVGPAGEPHGGTGWGCHRGAEHPGPCPEPWGCGGSAAHTILRGEGCSQLLPGQQLLLRPTMWLGERSPACLPPPPPWGRQLPAPGAGGAGGRAPTARGAPATHPLASA